MKEADLRPTPNTGHIIYAQWAVKQFGGNAAMGLPDGWWGKVSAMCCAELINNWNAFSGDHVPNNGGALGIDQWGVLDMFVNHSLGRV